MLIEKIKANLLKGERGNWSLVSEGVDYTRTSPKYWSESEKAERTLLLKDTTFTSNGDFWYINKDKLDTSLKQALK